MTNPADDGGARELVSRPDEEVGHLTGFSPPPQDLADARFRRAVVRLYDLGPRAVLEPLSEIGRARMCRVLIEQRVDAYCRLDPRVLRELGGDRLPPAPLYEVER